MKRVLFLLAVCAAVALQAADQERPRKGGGGGRKGGGGGGSKVAQTTKASEQVPAHPFDIILGRPTATTVTLSVLCYQDAEGWIAYGTERSRLDSKISPRKFPGGEPVEVLLTALRENTQYFYRFHWGNTNSSVYTFHTVRPPGSTFAFTVTADSHLDENTTPSVYMRTLSQALASQPDFHVDLGDTFMTGKHASREAAAKQYLGQRYYFGQLAHSVPLFLVLGNHDGESPRGRGNESDSLAVWANLTRKRYFPNPAPSEFFLGNTRKHPDAGLLQDYYAWKWGDAMFVVLDPFWFTQAQRGQEDNWKRTLGEQQYQWLKDVLVKTSANFKFIFIHHLVGGNNAQCRGGSEAAVLYEWGGKNPDGSDGFHQNRPGWAAPIHQLLVKNGVNIVFHGHDHFYARQELDGIVYQEVPQPGNPGRGDGAPRNAAEYGYVHGTILGGAGHLRVTVAPANISVDYIKSSDATVAHSYTAFPRNSVAVKSYLF